MSKGKEGQGDVKKIYPGVIEKANTLNLLHITSQQARLITKDNIPDAFAKAIQYHYFSLFDHCLDLCNGKAIFSDKYPLWGPNSFCLDDEKDQIEMWQELLGVITAENAQRALCMARCDDERDKDNPVIKHCLKLGADMSFIEEIIEEIPPSCHTSGNINISKGSLRPIPLEQITKENAKRLLDEMSKGLSRTTNEAIIKCLELGADYNSKSLNGYDPSPWATALTRNNITFIKTCISIHPTLLGTALSHAVNHGSQYMVQELVKDLSTNSQRNSTLVHDAIKRGDAGILSTLLNNGFAYIESNGLNILHFAAMYGNSAMIDIALKQEPGSLNRPGNGGNTALHLAKDVAITEKLLALGADLTALNSAGQTALHCAVEQHYQMCVARRNSDIEPTQQVVYLTKRMNLDLINKADKNGDTALDLAIKRSVQPFVSELLQKGATTKDPVKTLTDAIKSGNIKIISIFLDHNFSCEKSEEFKIVHAAITHGSSKIIDMVLAKYPDSLNKPDNNGNTALHLDTNCVITEKLLALGADPTALNSSGQTALHCAVEQHNNTCITMRKPNIQPTQITLLIKAMNVELINKADNNGNTALSLASQKKLASIVPILLESGAIPEPQSKIQQDTPQSKIQQDTPTKFLQSNSITHTLIKCGSFDFAAKLIATEKTSNYAEYFSTLVNTSYNPTTPGYQELADVILNKICHSQDKQKYIQQAIDAGLAAQKGQIIDDFLLRHAPQDELSLTDTVTSHEPEVHLSEISGNAKLEDID